MKKKTLSVRNNPKKNHLFNIHNMVAKHSPSIFIQTFVDLRHSAQYILWILPFPYPVLLIRFFFLCWPVTNLLKTWFKWEYIFWYSRKRENFRYHVYMAFLIEKTIYIMLAVFFFSRHISISFYISFSNSSWFGSPKLIVKFSPVDIESKKKPSNQAIKNFSKNSASFNSKRERKKNHSFWWLYSLYVRRITRVCFCKLVNKRNEKKNAN